MTTYIYEVKRKNKKLKATALVLAKSARDIKRRLKKILGKEVVFKEIRAKRVGKALKFDRDVIPTLSEFCKGTH